MPKARGRIHIQTWLNDDQGLATIALANYAKYRESHTEKETVRDALIALGGTGGANSIVDFDTLMNGMVSVLDDRLSAMQDKLLEDFGRVLLETIRNNGGVIPAIKSSGESAHASEDDDSLLNFAKSALKRKGK